MSVFFSKYIAIEDNILKLESTGIPEVGFLNEKNQDILKTIVENQELLADAKINETIIDIITL